DHGNRENRKKARLKVVIEKWGVVRFLDELELRLGRQLTRAAAPEPLHTGCRSHVGIHNQKQRGMVYVGLAIVAGRFQRGQLARLAELAEQYGDGNLRTTVDQSILLVDIQQSSLPSLERSLNQIGLTSRPTALQRNVIACTGIQFCKLALAETKARA